MLEAAANQAETLTGSIFGDSFETPKSELRRVFGDSSVALRPVTCRSFGDAFDTLGSSRVRLACPNRQAPIWIEQCTGVNAKDGIDAITNDFTAMIMPRQTPGETASFGSEPINPKGSLCQSQVLRSWEVTCGCNEIKLTTHAHYAIPRRQKYIRLKVYFRQ